MQGKGNTKNSNAMPAMKCHGTRRYEVKHNDMNLIEMAWHELK